MQPLDCLNSRSFAAGTHHQTGTVGTYLPTRYLGTNRVKVRVNVPRCANNVPRPPRIPGERYLTHHASAQGFPGIQE